VLGTGEGLAGLGVGLGLAGRQLTALLAPAVARAWLKAVEAPAERACANASAGGGGRERSSQHMHDAVSMMCSIQVFLYQPCC
jgi:hypothetical protein